MVFEAGLSPTTLLWISILMLPLYAVVGACAVGFAARLPPTTSLNLSILTLSFTFCWCANGALLPHKHTTTATVVFSQVIISLPAVPGVYAVGFAAGLPVTLPCNPGGTQTSQGLKTCEILSFAYL